MAKAKKKPVTKQMVVKQDCLKLATQHLGMYATSAGVATLALIDPPYNIGMPYEAYADNKTHKEYLAFTRNWMEVAKWLLHKHGTMMVFVPDEWVCETEYMAKHDFGLYKRQHIIWAFTFGVACQGKFSRSHCHILYLTKTKTKFTFNADAIRVPSARQLVYNDNRQNPKGKLPDATWMLLKEQMLPYMQPSVDTWLENRICGTYNEREKHSPNQLPIPLMERIVKACSNPHDLVIDLFAGTGSAGVACAMHDRNYLGFDISKTCVKKSNERIQKVRA